MSDSDVIDITDSPVRPKPAIPVPPPAPKLPRSNVLAGKTFLITGTWMTMTLDHAKELCKANGGRVASTSSSKIDYIVHGARSGNPAHRTTPMLTERQFLEMILPKDSSEGNKENASRKRPAADSIAPAKPSKAARKSDPGPGAPKERAYTRVHSFLCDGDVELKGKTLKAFDCGGEVYKAQRGKSVIDLLDKFEDWLESCDGEYHSYL